MKLIQPVTFTDAMLLSSSVAETDHAAWSSGTTYGLGARVIKTSTHRIYESLIAGNIGNDPAATGSTQWLDVGPTNRWGMLDGAAGSATLATGSIVVVIKPGMVDTIAVLDAIAETVRVEVAPDYDETLPVDDRAVLTFHDLPGGATDEITITIEGSGTVAASVLLAGTTLDLGTTEAAPSVGIIDYSKRETDEFGVTKVVERSWSKTMTARSKIATDDTGTIQRALARLRATPALWLGEEGYDSLAVYGFAKTFSIDLALPTISYLSVNIEGLAA